MREIRDIILSSKTLILLIFCFFLFCDLYYQSNQKKTFLLTDFYKFNNLFIEETDLDLYTTVKEILDSEEFLRRSFLIIKKVEGSEKNLFIYSIFYLSIVFAGICIDKMI